MSHTCLSLSSSWTLHLIMPILIPSNVCNPAKLLIVWFTGTRVPPTKLLTLLDMQAEHLSSMLTILLSESHHCPWLSPSEWEDSILTACNASMSFLHIVAVSLVSERPQALADGNGALRSKKIPQFRRWMLQQGRTCV
jgi:hypothetical protein